MKYKIQYGTQEERQTLIKNHQNLRLIEEHNLVEGNFLVFTDEPALTPAESPRPMIIMTEAEYLALKK